MSQAEWVLYIMKKNPTCKFWWDKRANYLAMECQGDSTIEYVGNYEGYEVITRRLNKFVAQMYYIDRDHVIHVLLLIHIL